MKSNYWNKIKKKKTDWGPAPTEASENIKAPELAPRDKRFTGRTKKLGLMTTPEFHQQLKKIAAEENCLMIEVVEKAVAEYSKKIKQH
jgi:hypothetical protein